MPKPRGKSRLPLGNVLHILCEGECTEPNYIRRYVQLACRGSRSAKVETSTATSPVQLVEEAIKLKRSSEVAKGDQYWVVYDRESETQCPPSQHRKAVELAKKEGINIAISGISFEVWLLLHKQSHCAACSTCLELLHRKDFQAAFPGYEKGAEIPFTVEQCEFAKDNAKRMNLQTWTVADPGKREPYQLNPYTNMYELLDAIDGFCRRCVR